jgi:hypothetical protein
MAKIECKRNPGVLCGDMSKCATCGWNQEVEQRRNKKKTPTEKKKAKQTYFERIAPSPEVLGEFLGSLPILQGPWDDDFQRHFCDACEAVNCDAENCPHQAERNNPTWWLKLETGPGECGV